MWGFVERRSHLIVEIPDRPLRRERDDPTDVGRTLPTSTEVTASAVNVVINTGARIELNLK